jgi:hypothetical protein
MRLPAEGHRRAVRRNFRLDQEASRESIFVRSAQEVFLPVWEQTRGDDGCVSFELGRWLKI